MPRIDVSDVVLAGLRALHEREGETDDAVLRRLLASAAVGADDAPGGPPARPRPEPGFVDATYGIPFAEGFEIFRTYKGRPFSARVESGRWRLDADGRAYDSLNQLSQAVIDGNENAWMFWFFRDAGGTPSRIAELRDPATIQRRPRRRRRAVPGPGPGRVPGMAPAVPPPAPETEPTEARPAPEAPVHVPPERPPPPATPPSPESSSGGMAWEPRTDPRRR
ncbi:MAG: hypothetical protein ACE5GT_12965 [Rhodospirillales bacterium]